MEIWSSHSLDNHQLTVAAFTGYNVALSRLRLDSGTQAILLPDPAPWGMAFYDHIHPAVSYGVFEKGLAYGQESAQHADQGLMEVEQVLGNVDIQAPLWTEPMLLVYKVEGDLSYCTSGLSTSKQSAWLAAMTVAGTVTNSCP